MRRFSWKPICLGLLCPLLSASVFAQSDAITARAPLSTRSQQAQRLSPAVNSLRAQGARPQTASTPQVEAPQFSLAPGTYAGTQTLTITDATAGATIYYRTDGGYLYTKSGLRNYFTTGGQQYTGPITISSSAVVVAAATETGYTPSEQVVGRYTISTAQSRFIYSLAGSGRSQYSGDGGPATFAQLNQPQGVALDAAGNIYIGDTQNNVIRKIDAKTGNISTIAGTGVAGDTGDGGPAASAELNAPGPLVVDATGNIYFWDWTGLVRKIDSSGTISTVLTSNFSAQSVGFAVDAQNNVFFADGASEVFKIPANGGTATVFAGGGTPPLPGSGSSLYYFGDGGPATQAGLQSPGGLAIDAQGNLYIADSGNNVIRMVNSAGIISTVAGGANNYVPGDGGPALQAQLANPQSIGFDAQGNLYIADINNGVIRMVDTSQNIHTIAGIWGGTSAAGGDGDPADCVALFIKGQLSVDATGNLYFPDWGGNRIRKVTAPVLPPTQQTQAPVLSLTGGTYPSAQSLTLSDATPGATVYVNLSATTPTSQYDSYYGEIPISGSVTVSTIALAPGYLPSAPVTATYTIGEKPLYTVSTIAGTGDVGYLAAGGPALTSPFGGPASVAVNANGDIFISDETDNVVWKVSAATGNMTVYAGTSLIDNYGGGNGGPATSASLWKPTGLAVDAAGNLYISDTGHGVVRVVNAQTGIISAFAGGGSGGDGGAATSARLYAPLGLAADAAGNLFIADEFIGIRKVDATTHVISTVAGGGTSQGDGGPAVNAGLYPMDVTVDGKGNLYISDAQFRIRKVDAATGIINTIAGNGYPAESTTGVAATATPINPGLGIAVDASGNVYFSNGVASIDEIEASTGNLLNLAGNGFPFYNGDGLAAAMTGLYLPQGLAFDPAGNLVFADTDDFRVRKVIFPAPAATPTFSIAAGAYNGPQSVTISDTTTGAVIYYTLNGTTPDANATPYSSAVTVSQNQTLKAIAIAPGFTASAVASAAYTIKPIPATVTWPQPAAIPYGTPLGAAQLDATANTHGTFVYSPAAGAVLSGGSHTIGVTFTPDAGTGYTSASAIVSQNIDPATPTVSVAADSNPILVSNTVTLTATVSFTTGTPSGSVTFFDGATEIGFSTLSSGKATLTTSALLTVGTHSITAAYQGDSNFAATTSPAVAEVVEDFTFASPGGGSNSATVQPGGTATYNLAFTPPSGQTFPTAITLSASGMPSGATATFSPQSVPAGAGQTTVVLTIQLPQSGAAAAPAMGFQYPTALGLLLLPLLGFRKKARKLAGALVALTALACVLVLAPLTACGGGGSSTSAQPQIYTVTVTATAGNLSHTTALTLTVE